MARLTCIQDGRSPIPTGKARSSAAALQFVNGRGLSDESYPDFQSALEAIRSQVDDYLVKPCDIPTLVNQITEKVRTHTVMRRALPKKRVADVIRESSNAIVADWMHRVAANPELAAVHLSDEERKDHLPQKLAEFVGILESHPEKTSPKQMRAAFLYGKARREHGYTAPMIVEESRLLERCIFDTLQANLLSIDISQLIPDMVHVADSSQIQLKESLRVYLDAGKGAAAA